MHAAVLSPLAFLFRRLLRRCPRPTSIFMPRPLPASNRSLPHSAASCPSIIAHGSPICVARNLVHIKQFKRGSTDG
jgi:hypothetical protein